jgi:hypothetical protein
VQVENATARDGRLSFRATGLLVHLLSLPDGAPIGAVALAGHRPEGRTAIQAAYKELREHGYVSQQKLQGVGGQWRTVTHVYEVPPDAENLRPVPDAGNPVPVDLRVSLTGKDRNEKRRDQGSSVFSCCGQQWQGVTAYQDHLEVCTAR